MNLGEISGLENIWGGGGIPVDQAWLLLLSNHVYWVK